MILPDVNLLIYAYNKSDKSHRIASIWFENLLNSDEKACFCRETIDGFVRISTNSAAMPNPYSLPEAFSIVRSWLDLPNVMLLRPTENHLDILQAVSIDANAVGRLYSDAILAAYAVAHNATIASADRNFRLFNGIKLINPLAST